MEKTSVYAFTANPTVEDIAVLTAEQLRLAGIKPVPTDPYTVTPEIIPLGKKDKEERRQVSARVSAQTVRMLQEIVEARVLPGIKTISDAMSAAATVWVQLVHPRMESSGFTENWRAMRSAKRLYDAGHAQITALKMSETIASAIGMAYGRDDIPAVIEGIEVGWQMMEDIGMPRALEFERRVMKDQPVQVRDLWEAERARSKHDLFERERLMYLEELAKDQMGIE